MLALLSPAVLAADANTPHPHQGVLPKYTSKPAKPDLSADDLARLAAGEPVLRQVKDATGTGGSGVAIEDVHAEPAAIWAQIEDFASYPRKVQNVLACDVTSRAGDHTYVHFVIGVPVFRIEYWVDDVIRPDEGYLTWTLDYSKTSDFDDTVGFWIVEALPDKPGWSRVYYSARIKAKGWVPPIVEDGFTRLGLTRSTEWVKREAEAAGSR